MRRTFFYSVLLSLFSCLMIRHARPSSSTRPRQTIKQHPHTPNHQAAPAHANHQAAPRHTTTTPHHANGEGGEPPHALTLTTSTDRHTIDRFRESEGAPSPRLVCLTPCAVRPRCTAVHHRPPGCASEYTYKLRLTLTTPKGCRAAVALSWSRFVQNHNSL